MLQPLIGEHPPMIKASHDSSSNRAESSERVVDVAAILANAILRLHARTALSSDVETPDASTDFCLASLEVSPETVLSVHTG